jgi:6-phosphogluconolactonase
MVVAFEKESLPAHLNSAIAEICKRSILERGVFTIALSGGSLPLFLSTMEEAFEELEIEMNLSQWHVILADERCVPSGDRESNLKALRDNVFSEVRVPPSQIYGINESLLPDAEAVAVDYEATVKKVLNKSGGFLDVAVLGFGPDGHTCSLFPEHALLAEDTKLVAALTDSPKPPAARITLTLPLLNTKTRHVIVCGAGASKGPILRNAFISLTKSDAPCKIPRGDNYKVVLENDPAPYPCGMVVPNIDGYSNTLTWIVDAEAMTAGESAPSPY